jgi:hypothetical protein
MDRVETISRETGLSKKTGVDEQEDREFSPLACSRQSNLPSLSSNRQAGVD